MNQNVDVSPKQCRWKTFVLPQHTPANRGAIECQEELVQETRQRGWSSARDSAAISLVQCVLILRNGRQMIVQLGFCLLERSRRAGTWRAIRMVAWDGLPRYRLTSGYAQSFCLCRTSIGISDHSVDLNNRRCSLRPATRKVDMAKGTAGCRRKHLGHGVGGICHVLF